MSPLIDIQLCDGPVHWSALAPFPPDSGAECVFLGRTRLERHARLGPLVRLDYHAHESMARSILEALARGAVAAHGCTAVRLLHALGGVPVGKASVLVQVAAPHRDAAFVAARRLIDELKATAPIWKREVWAEGETWSPGQDAPGAGTLAGSPGPSPSS